MVMPIKTSLRLGSLRALAEITSASGRRSIPAGGVARRLNTSMYSPSSRLACRATRRPLCDKLISARALIMLSWLLVQGCIFDGTGLKGRPDGPVPDHPRIEDSKTDPDGKRDQSAPLDRALESNVDLKRDARTDLSTPCQATQWGKLCRPDPGNSYGQSGRCEGEKFILERYCFDGQKCDTKSGYCYSSGGCSIKCSNCQGENNVCTAFFNPNDSSIFTCCVSLNLKNGTGRGATACAANTACKSGLCTLEGNCYEYCTTGTIPDTCPNGSHCGNVSLPLGTPGITTFGCVKDPSPDAGPSSE
jgi:hypothetical protein